MQDPKVYNGGQLTATIPSNKFNGARIFGWHKDIGTAIILVNELLNSVSFTEMTTTEENEIINALGGL